MASIEEGTARKLATGLADQRLSPAILAMKISRENVAVNEAMLSMLINYIIIVANKSLIPFHMKQVQDICKMILPSLEELGLTGRVQQETLDNHEYLAV